MEERSKLKNQSVAISQERIVLLLQFDMEEINKKGRRLILFPLPLESHINPMLQLANILHSNGFSITIIHTQFNALNPSTHPHFTFHSIPDGLSETEASIKDILLLFHLLNTKCIEPFRECLARILLSDDDVADDPVACLISDHLFHFTRSVAEGFRLPNLVLETGAISPFNVFRSFPLLREKGYLPVQDSRREDLVEELPPLKVKDLPVIPNGDPENYYQLCALVASKLVSSDGLIFNTFQDLEQDVLCTLHQEIPNLPIFPIGPFHKRFPEVSFSNGSLSSQDQGCMSWLDIQAPKSVIYVSLGTIAAIDEAQFLEIAWGLANSNQPFLWVVRPGSVRGSEWLEPLPSGFLQTLNGRGHVVKWAPQKDVLAHSAVGAFWTHNGWNSTLESISEGIPMICMPCFNDQMVIARYVSDVWKVGLQFQNGVDRDEIKRTIRKLMVEEEGNETRDRSLKLMEKASNSLKKGGSSNQALDALVTHILSFN